MTTNHERGGINKRRGGFNNSPKQSLKFNIRLSIFHLNMGAKQLAVDVKDNVAVMYNLKAFEVGSTLRLRKCLDRLGFVIDRWFLFNLHHFQIFIASSNTTTQYSSLFASSIFVKSTNLFLFDGTMQRYAPTN